MRTRACRNRCSWSARLAGLATALPLTIATSAYGFPPRHVPLPTDVNVYTTLSHRLIGAEIAVNPRNPLNIVVADVEDDGYTQACQAVPDPLCVLEQTPFGPTPVGYFTAEPEFSTRHVFTSFDGGLTWTKVDVSASFPAGKP